MPRDSIDSIDSIKDEVVDNDFPKEESNMLSDEGTINGPDVESLMGSDEKALSEKMKSKKSGDRSTLYSHGIKEEGEDKDQTKHLKKVVQTAEKIDIISDEDSINGTDAITLLDSDDIAIKEEAEQHRKVATSTVTNRTDKEYFEIEEDSSFYRDSFRRLSIVNADAFLARHEFKISQTSLPPDPFCAPLREVFQSNRPYTSEELTEVFKTIDKLSFKGTVDSHKIHINMGKLKKIVKTLLRRLNIDLLTETHVVHLLWAVICCIHHYEIRLKPFLKIIGQIRNHDYNVVVELYEEVLEKLPRKFDEFGLFSVLIFLREGLIWPKELLCTEILVRILKRMEDPEIGIINILRCCEQVCAENVDIARNILQVLSLCLEQLKLDNISVNFINYFITLYKITIEPNENQYNYKPLKNGLRYCINVIIMNISFKDRHLLIETILSWVLTEQLTNDTIADFTHIIEFIGFCLKKQNIFYLKDVKLLEVFNDILDSSNIYKVNLALKCFHSVCDSCGNISMFDTPRIFFLNNHANLKIGKYKSANKRYFKLWLHQLYEKFLTCIIQHLENREILEDIYCCMCIMIVEIPCGLTAAAAACWALGLQNFAVEAIKQMSTEFCYYLHATVVAIMSLISYVHNGKIFYDYISAIIEIRATKASYLNPPLKGRSEYSSSQSTYVSDEFLFSDWEIRYCLWKNFKTKQAKLLETADFKNRY